MFSGIKRTGGLSLILTATMIFQLCTEQSVAQQGIRDLYSDTWVGTDALNRKMPSIAEAGPVKNDQRRVVGIFYITWHSDNLAAMKSPYNADVTKVLKGDTNARYNPSHPLWTESSFHWGEPESGYFLSKDEYIIRNDMSMLTDAGVDVLIMDVTNAVRYWDEWEVVFTTMQKMVSEGNKVPQFCFWAFNGEVIQVVQDLYDKIYTPGRFKDLWFYWDGKPLLLYNKNPEVDANSKGIKGASRDYSPEVEKYFTLRNMWWGYYQWAGERFVGTEDNWSFGYDLGDPKVKGLDPMNLVSLHLGKREEAAVTPAQHPSGLVGKSWTRESGEPVLNGFDLPDSAFVPWLGKTVKHPEGYGIYFQDRWNEALKADPQFIYLNDWNEWCAGKYPPRNGVSFPFMRRKSLYYFVDQYNAEFNRCIEPMKDGYTDNYYMQMAQNIRRYKGVRPLPESKGIIKIRIDGDFSDWNAVTNEFRDTKGDTFHRDYNGYGGLHFINNSGRNDLLNCKVAVDKKEIYFSVSTDQPISEYTGENWMLLLIDADQNPLTGWYGYDYLINKNVIDQKTTTVMAYDPSNADNPWKEKARISYACKGSKMEMAIPRELLCLTANKISFDFKWCDHPTDLKDPISLCTNGDAAPNRRFNYRYIWKLK